MIQVGLVLGGVYVGYRMLQALHDVEFEGRTLPKEVRDALKYQHLDEHGEYCPCYGTSVTFFDLVIDHIVPFSLGGRTSIAPSGDLPDVQQHQGRQGDSR